MGLPFKNNTDMDLFERIKRDSGPLAQYADQAEGYYMFPKLEGELASRMTFKGREVIVWSINNYLGLGNHPEIRKVDAEASAKWGLAYPMGSRMMSGNTELHEKLEQQLAEFVHKKAAVLVNYGYQGIMSAITSMLGRHDVVVYDEESHACIMDGVFMHPGERKKFRHNDIEDLEKRLAWATEKAARHDGGILVISEGVFGMKGDQGKLKEIIALKEKYDFRLLVDDAHGFGVLGATGAGTGEEQGVQDGIDVYFATFAKSMASIGAFLASNDERIIQFLKYSMRSQVFAKSLPMAFVEGDIKRLEMLRTMPELRQKLWANVNALQNGLKERGYDIGGTNSCVTPVFLKGSPEEASQLVYDLRENYGIFCSMVIYPVIPKGEIILRLIPTAAHTQADIDESLDAFDAVSEKLRTGKYSSEVITDF